MLAGGASGAHVSGWDASMAARLSLVQTARILPRNPTRTSWHGCEKEASEGAVGRLFSVVILILSTVGAAWSETKARIPSPVRDEPSGRTQRTAFSISRMARPRGRIKPIRGRRRRLGLQSSGLLLLRRQAEGDLRQPSFFLRSLGLATLRSPVFPGKRNGEYDNCQNPKKRRRLGNGNWVNSYCRSFRMRDDRQGNDCAQQQQERSRQR